MTSTLAPLHRWRLAVATSLALAALFLAAFTSGVGAQVAGEHIQLFTIDATIEPDGGVTFRETIVYDFGDLDRHGIFRDIVTSQRYDDRSDRHYDLEAIVVTSPSAATPVEYAVEGVPGLTRIRIGDPDRTISGVHTYQITYRLRGILNAFEDHDELYWNMIAPVWQVPIAATAVTVRAPAPPTEIACFAGPERSANPCDGAVIEDQRAVFSEGILRPYQAFSVVVGLPKGAVANPTPLLHQRWSFERSFAVDTLRLGLMMAVLGGVLSGVFRLVWMIGRDRQNRGQVVAAIPAPRGAVQERVPAFNGTVTPTEYLPPGGMRPALVGTVLDETAHPLDVSAAIVDLAVRGYLRIEEIAAEGWFGSEDWRLTRVKPSQGLKQYEITLLDGLFEDGDEVLFSDLRTRFAARLAQVQEALYQEMVDRGWYRRSPNATRSAWRGLGIASLATSVGVCVAAAVFTTFAIVPIPLALGAVVLIALAGRMPARTGDGTAVYRRVLGFRRFIVEAETERARFAERAGLFYEYLPYAIVFGATKQWAKAFEGLALPQPDWYVASHAFTTLALVNAMGAFSDRSVSTLSSTPGGSGSSGFGGGGFSGGGGGGGGGGSW